MLSRNIKVAILRLVGSSAFAILFAIFGYTAQAQAASVHVTGTVSSQAGAAVQNVTITATTVGGSTVQFGPIFSASNGTYVLDVDPGSYDFHFVPPTSSSLNPVVVSNFTLMTDQVLNAQFTPITHAFSGTLLNSAGNPLNNVGIFLNGSSGQANGNTDSSGNFNLAVAPGTYSARVRWPGSGGGAFPTFTFVDLIESQAGVDLTAGDVSENLHVADVPLTITVKDGSGNPIANTQVAAIPMGGSTSVLPSGAGDFAPSNVQSFGNTDANGVAHLATFAGLSFTQRFGANSQNDNICALTAGTPICISSPQTITGPSSISLNQPVTHTFSGTLRNSSGSPLGNVGIYLNGGSSQANTTTDSSGHFSMAVTPGQYAARVRWPGSGGGAFPTFTFVDLVENQSGVDLTSGDVVENLATADVPLTITVKDGNGNPITNTQVAAIPMDGTTAILPGGVADFTPSNVQSFGNTDLNGVAHVATFAGLKFAQRFGATSQNDNICALVSGTPICLPAPLIVNGAMSLTLSQPPTTHVFSGTLLNAAGSALNNVQIILNNSSGQATTTTDSSGHFSAAVTPGSYSVRVRWPGSGGGAFPTFTFVDLIENQSGVDLSSGNVNEILQVADVPVTVIVKDSNGNPISGTQVAAIPMGGTTTILPGGASDFTPSNVQSFGNTDANGVAHVATFSGLTFGQRFGATSQNDNICALVSGTPICLNAPLNVTGALTLVLQQSPPTPIAPTGLSASTPTNSYPALTWNPVNFSVNYRVYRNGTQVGSTSNPNFVDSTIGASNSYTYTVTGVNSNDVEGPSSTSLTVVYDKDAPTIIATAIKADNGAYISGNWVNQAVTVHFSCSDSLSGIANCPADQLLSADTAVAGMDVIGTATDNAGNSAATSGLNVKIDKSVPIIVAHATTPSGDYAGGWTNQPVTVHFTCTDSLSGVATCSADTTINSSTPPAGISVSGTSLDNAGNSVSGSPVIVKVDMDGPVITASATSADAGVYAQGTWTNQTVTVHFTCSDSLSGIASCPSDRVVSADTIATGTEVVGTASDNSGNTATSLPINVKVDKTAPAISAHATTPTGDYTGGWTNQTVTLQYTCGDTLSGVATCPANTIISSSTPANGTSVTGTATDNAGNNSASLPVIVKVDKSAPMVTASAKTADGNGYVGGSWTNQTVTVHFTCTDALSGVASCEADHVLTANTIVAGTEVAGGTIDNAGNTATSSPFNVKIDKDLPTVGNATWSTNPVAVGTNSTLTVPAADALSAVVGGEYYIGSDPGVGNGTPLTYSTGSLSATFGSALGVGVYNIGARAKDAASNWSPVTTTMLVVYDPSSTLGMTGKNKKDLVPSLSAGDIMPGLNSSAQTDVADYGFTVQYKNGVLDPKNDFHFNYITGTNCGKSNAQNCHSFALDATSFAWLLIDQTNTSRGRYQGTATIIVDGVTTTNPFTVQGIDGDRLTPSANDTLLLKVFAPGANPTTASPVYQSSGSMAKGTSVKIQ